MWLLNACTWEMKEFISHKQAPPYAILSHTWGEEEVLFRDWQHGSWQDVQKKGGFGKIKNCCEKATAEGLEWVWIDTCCIDKSSSAELSEAINSMFQWYQSAAVCYAYLCDVSDNIELNIAGSHWITRGWTLQELIAPREVVFYSCNWQSLGARSGLSACLAMATGIHEPFLVGKNLNEASIAQRMSWAARRSTSREEDEAYCLLGIFNVNMPLIYGEGLKAFRRLQETLVHEYPRDHSLFAWGKVVKRLSNEVDNDQSLDLKPLSVRHNPDKVEMELFGLLAKRPRDFQHSGEVVCAPSLKYYFQYGQSTVSALSGDTAFVNLPMVDGPTIAKHLKLPLVVQLLRVILTVLQCGQWNDLRTEFHYVAVPVLLDGRQTSRLGEIIINTLYVRHGYNLSELAKCVRNFSIQPMLLSSPRNGDVIIRRLMSTYSKSQKSHHKIDFSYLRGLVEMSGLEKCGVFTSITFSEQDAKEYGLTIVIIRLEAVNDSHEDSTQARNSGSLAFRLNLFTSSGQNIREFSVINEKGNSRAAVAKEKPKLMSFQDEDEAGVYAYKNWEDLAYGHDMVLPRDEWRLSIIGLADVYISVERMFLDGYDSDNDSGNGGSHPFVDILDLVVRENLDEDNTVERDCEDDEYEEPKTEKKRKRGNGGIERRDTDE